MTHSNIVLSCSFVFLASLSPPPHYPTTPPPHTHSTARYHHPTSLPTPCAYSYTQVTKYIGGHSDVVMGAVCCNRDDVIEKLRFVQNGSGAVPSPFDCYLALRGLKTLHVRMNCCQSNAMAIARYLEGHSLVSKVRQ